ncbi:MAG: hypothetical protein HQ582_13070 [Planctomycetes bacterium]|nr:hypothetical protein [Planctomycetota bacterium]
MVFAREKAATDDQFREFLTLAHRYLTEIDEVYDVRWFKDQFLTCHCFHPGDFEYGALTPFEP